MGKYTYYSTPKGNIQLLLYRRNRRKKQLNATELVERVENITEEEKYFLIQKSLGLVLMLISLIVPMLLGDGTASVFLLPLGMAVFFTKDKVIVL